MDPGQPSETHLRSMSKGRASRRAKSHQTMTQANSKAVDKKSTMFQADLKYDRKEPCSSASNSHEDKQYISTSH